MRLSIKSTFSLVCFILLFTFVAVPTMAHDGTVGNLDHNHPLLETLPAVNLNPGTGPGQDNDTDDTGEAEVTPHNAHPMVTSIVLKGDNTRGTMAAVVTDDTNTADVSEDEFTLVVTFDRDVVSAAATTTIPDFSATDLTSGAQLETADLTSTLLNVDNTDVAGSPTFVINRVDGNNAQYEVVVTPAALPNADDDDATTNDNTLTFRIRVIAGGVFSLQTRGIPPNEVNAIDVPGGGNFESDIYVFTLVSALPEVPTPPDTDAPTLVITHDPADRAALPASGNVTFTFTFNEALGTNDNAFSLGDVTITNGSAVDFTASGNIYTVEVKPTDPTQAVTVSVAATAVADASGNNLAVDVMETYMADDTAAPTVVINAVPATGDDAGKVLFTFTFSEPITDFTSDDLIRGTGVTLAGNPTVDPTDNKVWTVLVNPSTSGDTILTLKTGSVMDMQDNPLVGDQAHTYEPPAAVTAATITDPADPANAGNTEAGATVTVTFSKDPGTVTAMIGTTDSLTVAGTGTSRMITIPATQAVGSVAIALTWDNSGSATVTYTIPMPDPNTSPVITIAPESFVVVVREDTGTRGLNFRDDVTVMAWAGMPDLERLFYTGNDGIILGGGGGGALILRESASQSPDLAPGTVGISEIMWAIDANHLGNPNLNMYAGSQWIELHNLNTEMASVTLSWKTGREITNDSSITGNLADPVLDVVTNFFHDRPGNARWEVPGSNGASVAGVNFVSMARNGTFSLNRRTDNNAGKPLNGRYTRTAGSEHSRDGRNKDHWSAASSAYLSARTTRTDGNDVLYDYVGTPGRVNTFSAEAQPHIKAGRTGIPSDNIIISEVGNLSGNNYDWIELLNRSGGEINLRNYMISIVTSNSSDVPLVQFDANDNAKVAAGAVFLILRTDPADDTSHPIAATGYNVDKSVEEQQPGTPNSPVRYKVFNGGARGALNLPDDGKFVLIVRKPDNHEGQRSGADGGKGVAETGNADLNRIVDVAGWDDDLAKNSYPNAVSNTGVWPLYAMGGIGGFTNNKLEVGKVHFRRHVTTNDGRAGIGGHENKNDKSAFTDAGWTGVGYRRDVANTAMHYGTPGYPNNASHGAGGTVTSAVYISEIMYADAANGSLPQWIELRNPSNTIGADLHNWRLTIINHADRDAFEDGLWEGKAEATVLLRGLKIKPNGTVLITSRKGPRSEVHLADSEIFSLFPSHRGAFGMKNANSDVINPFGFRIILQANAHDTGKRNEWQLVEDFGNLAAPDPKDRRGDNERFDMPLWMWPDANAEDGGRISVVRKVKSKDTLEPTDGSKRWSWVLADVDSRTALIDHVYYGHTDDTSTPGQTVGQPLPVSLSFFRPELEDGEIVIRWTTESELDNAGFNIYRSDARDGEFKKVNAALIQGNGTTGERSTYKWVDESAKPGAVYYYQIEDVSFAGERQTLATTRLKGLISAKNKATTIWGEIKEVQ